MSLRWGKGGNVKQLLVPDLAQAPATPRHKCSLMFRVTHRRSMSLDLHPLREKFLSRPAGFGSISRTRWRGSSGIGSRTGASTPRQGMCRRNWPVRGEWNDTAIGTPCTMTSGSITRTTSLRVRNARHAQAARAMMHDAWGWLGRSLAALLDAPGV